MVQVEVVEHDDAGYLSPRAAPLDDFRRRAPEIAEGIMTVAEVLRSQLEAKAAAHPREQRSGWAMDGLSLSFELALEAEAGVVIARAKTSATFSVEISWRREQPPPSGS
jgi:hypothetical protein